MLASKTQMNDGIADIVTITAGAMDSPSVILSHIQAASVPIAAITMHVYKRGSKNHQGSIVNHPPFSHQVGYRFNRRDVAVRVYHAIFQSFSLRYG